MKSMLPAIAAARRNARFELFLTLFVRTPERLRRRHSRKR